VEVNKTVLTPHVLRANAPVIAHVAQWQQAMHSFHFVMVQTCSHATALLSSCSLEEVSATKNQSPLLTIMAWS
jgi:hypothetical protein